MEDEKLANAYRLAETLIAEQNFAAGIAAAFAGALAGALAWGIAAVVIGAVPSWFAIALGALVGYGMQVFGRGLTTRYSVIAAGLAIVGCLTGYIVAAIIYEARGSAYTVGEVISRLHFADIVGFFVREFGFLDVSFLILAAAAAWYFAQRDLSRDQRFAVRKFAERPDPMQGVIR